MIKSTTLSLVRTEYLTVKERQEKSKTRLCSARKERERQALKTRHILFEIHKHIFEKNRFKKCTN